MSPIVPAQPEVQLGLVRVGGQVGTAHNANAADGLAGGFEHNGKGSLGAKHLADDLQAVFHAGVGWSAGSGANFGVAGQMKEHRGILRPPEP